MRGIVQILIGDAASKFILLLVNVILIRLLAVDEYAKFSIMINAIFLGYQLVCSAIERLYIADYNNFVTHSRRVLFYLIGGYALVFSIYLQSSVKLIELGIFVIGLGLTSCYQFHRIRYQQQENFILFSITELFKNGTWLILVLVLYLNKISVSSNNALVTFLVSVAFGLIAMSRGRSREGAPSNVQEVKSVLSIVIDSKEVFLYTLLAALVPYLPIVMANNEGNMELLATYGAAMRYLGLLGMIVYALNTVYLPKLANSSSRQEAMELVCRFLRAMPMTVGIMVIVALGITLAIPMIDGGKYPKLPIIFLILSGCSLLALVMVPLINFLLVELQFRKILLSMLLGFFSNIIAYVLLKGSIFGYEIALASLLGYAVISAVLLLTFCKDYYFPNPLDELCNQNESIDN